MHICHSDSDAVTVTRMTTAARGAAAENVVGMADPFVRWVAGEVRAHMARRGVRQAELARRLGVSQQWTSTRMKAVVPMTTADLARIAQALGMSPMELLSGESLPPEPGESGALTRGNDSSAFLPSVLVTASAITDGDGSLAPVISIRPHMRSNALRAAS